MCTRTGRPLSYYSRAHYRGRVSCRSFRFPKTGIRIITSATRTIRSVTRVPVGRGPRRTGREIYCRSPLSPCPPTPSVRHDSLCKNLLVPGRPRYVTRARKNGAADRGTTGSFGDANKSRATDSRTDGCVPCTGSNR